MTQHAVGMLINKWIRGKILAKTINVHFEHIKHCNSQESLLNCAKEKDQKIKEAQDKGTRVEVDSEPAAAGAVHFVRHHREEPEMLAPLLCGGIA